MNIVLNSDMCIDQKFIHEIDKVFRNMGMDVFKDPEGIVEQYQNANDHTSEKDTSDILTDMLSSRVICESGIFKFIESGYSPDQVFSDTVLIDYIQSNLYIEDAFEDSDIITYCKESLRISDVYNTIDIIEFCKNNLTPDDIFPDLVKKNVIDKVKSWFQSLIKKLA